jgi:hypothetical protein
MDEQVSYQAVKGEGYSYAVQPTQPPQNVAHCGYHSLRFVIPRSVTPSPSKDPAKG